MWHAQYGTRHVPMFVKIYILRVTGFVIDVSAHSSTKAVNKKLMQVDL